MSNLYNNEVIFNGQTLMSLKEDTVTPDKVLAGETFHDRSGAPQTGSLITHNVYDGLDSSSSSDALSANQGRVLNEKYDAVNSKIETGNDFDFALNGSQTSQFEINKKRAKIFGDIYILCLVLRPLVDIGTGEIQLGEVSVSPGLNTATVVTRNSDTKPIGAANLLENRKLYMNLTESVIRGNFIYISFATTYR